jgi:DNA repair exonuclease SbcCD nuclease subunit
MTDTKKRTWIEVFSDFHLGTIYSNGTSQLDDIYKRLNVVNQQITNGDLNEGVCIINGDLPDLDETYTPAATRQQALGIARHILDSYPNIKLVCMEGNHDNQPDYVDSLKELEQKYPGRFEYRKYFYRHGDVVAMHGHHVFGGARKSEQEKKPVVVADEGEEAFPKAHPILQTIYGFLKMMLTGIVAEQNFPISHLINRMEEALNDVATGAAGIGLARKTHREWLEEVIKEFRDNPYGHDITPEKFELRLEEIEALAEQIADLSEALQAGDIHHVLAGHVHWPEPLLNLELEVAGHPVKMHFTGAAVRDVVRGVPCIQLQLLQQDGITAEGYPTIAGQEMMWKADSPDDAVVGLLGEGTIHAARMTVDKTYAPPHCRYHS